MQSYHKYDPQYGYSIFVTDVEDSSYLKCEDINKTEHMYFNILISGK